MSFQIETLRPWKGAYDRPEGDAQKSGGFRHTTSFVRLEFSLFVLPVLRKTNVLNWR